MTPQQLTAMTLALGALEDSPMSRKNKDAIDALRDALADHAMKETQRLGQEIEQEPGTLHIDRLNQWLDASLKAKAAQPEQEPVAWMDADGNVSDNNDHKCFPIPLYTSPPQRTWVNPQDEEIKILWIQYRAALPRYLCFAKALLARAMEKNT